MVRPRGVVPHQPLEAAQVRLADHVRDLRLVDVGVHGLAHGQYPVHHHGVAHDWGAHQHREQPPVADPLPVRLWAVGRGYDPALVQLILLHRAPEHQHVLDPDREVPRHRGHVVDSKLDWSVWNSKNPISRPGCTTAKTSNSESKVFPSVSIVSSKDSQS